MTRRFIAPAQCWTPQALATIRAEVDLRACGLVAVDDASAWQLVATCQGGPFHTWQHRETLWLSQTMTVPTWALAEPARARAELCEKAAPLVATRVVAKRGKKAEQDERLVG